MTTFTLKALSSNFFLSTSLAGALALSACQSTGGGGTAAAPGASANKVALAEASLTPSTNAKQCKKLLASGPPPKPARGADFGTAVGKNLGKGVQRSAISNVAGRFGGGLGAAIGSGIANATVRNEEDLSGTWKITDGSPNCVCTLKVSNPISINSGASNRGSITPQGCSNATLASLKSWSLTKTFTGYDSKLALKNSRGQILMTLNRDGIHYFQGPVAGAGATTMWRDGQNHNAFGG